MKKFCNIILVICVVLYVPIALLHVFAITGAFALFYDDPPEPRIKYGEFPFTVVYEIKGETKTLNDTVICEYAGIKSLGTAGKIRAWKSHLKSGNKGVVLLQGMKDGTKFEIKCYPGGVPEYYMGDFRQSRIEYERVMHDTRYFDYILYDADGEMHETITEEDVYKIYNLRILELCFASPIENNFE